MHAGLSSIAGHPVVVKVETENPVGSFKGRGTWLAVRRLAAEGLVGRDRPVVVASSGNFGQGVAYAARAAGVGAVVFCDAAVNPVKADRIRALDADLRLVGRDFDEARAASEAFAADGGLTLLVDGDDVSVATGAATMALEVTDAIDRGELPPIANAYVPVGNGALIVGIGAWLRERGGEGVRVVGVQSEAAPSMERSWREGRVVETADAATYAEGIATRVPGADGAHAHGRPRRRDAAGGGGGPARGPGRPDDRARAHGGGLRGGVVGGPAGRSGPPAGRSRSSS